MPKGIRKQRSLAEELVGLDRMLMSVVRRNRSIAEHMAKESADPQARIVLERFLERHMLGQKPDNQELAKQETAPVTDRDRRIQRLNSYLPVLTDWDIENVMELIKSMHRFQMASRPRRKRPEPEGKAKPGEEGNQLDSALGSEP